MGGGACVLGRAGGGAGRSERGREALVERLDGDRDDGAKGLDETRRLLGLRAVLAAQRQRQPDNDALGALLLDQLGQTAQPRLRRRALDDLERAGGGR